MRDLTRAVWNRDSTGVRYPDRVCPGLGGTNRNHAAGFIASDERQVRDDS